MAVSASSLTGGTDNGPSVTSITTASVTPAASRLLLFTVVARRNDSIQPLDPTITGLGLTWNKILSFNADTIATSMKTITVYAANGSGTSGTVTADWGTGNPITDAAWILDQFSGATGTIPQFVTSPANTPAASASATMGAFSSGGNATYLVGWNDTSFTQTVGSGFTGVTGSGSTTNGGTLNSGFAVGNVSSLSISLSGSATNTSLLGLELQATFVAPDAVSPAYIKSLRRMIGAGSGGR